MNAKNQAFNKGVWATGRQKARNGSTNGTMTMFASAFKQAHLRPQHVNNHSI